MSADERSGWRDQEISLRHRKWGFNCPCTDLDFMLLEYNHGAPVAVVDYKHHEKQKPLDGMDDNAIKAMSNLFDERVVDLARDALEALDNRDSEAARGYIKVIADRGQNLPFFVARYWPGIWAFKVLAMNEPAKRWLRGGDWVPMSELTWVTGLYRMRQIAIDIRDKRYLDRLNTVMPPAEEEAA